MFRTETAGSTTRIIFHWGHKLLVKTRNYRIYHQDYPMLQETFPNRKAIQSKNLLWVRPVPIQDWLYQRVDQESLSWFRHFTGLHAGYLGVSTFRLALVFLCSCLPQVNMSGSRAKSKTDSERQVEGAHSFDKTTKSDIVADNSSLGKKK